MTATGLDDSLHDSNVVSEYGDATVAQQQFVILGDQGRIQKYGLGGVKGGLSSPPLHSPLLPVPSLPLHPRPSPFSPPLLVPSPPLPSPPLPLEVGPLNLAIQIQPALLTLCAL